MVRKGVNMIRTDSNAYKAVGFHMIARKCSEAYDAYFRGEMLCQCSRSASLYTFREAESDTSPHTKAGYNARMTCSVIPTRIQSCDKTLTGLKGISTSTEPGQEEEELLEFRAKMAHMEWLASLGARSAALAHELKQPLTVINLSMDDVLDELKATASHLQSATEEIKEAVTQVPNLTQIVDKFRNLARYPSENPISEVDVKAVAERVAKLFYKNQRQMRIVLSLREKKSLPPVKMNEKDLEQLFFCIFENSMHAAESIGNRQLIVDGKVKDGYVELRFSDDCGGIPPENIDRIFEPFFTTKQQGKGTGLGLCVAREIVVRAGGSIKVESDFGKSSTFFVSLQLDGKGYNGESSGKLHEKQHVF